MNILIVHDEYATIRDLRRVLEKTTANARIFEAENEKDSLKICKEEDIQVAFLDVEMPGKSGLALAGEIKKIRPMANIVILTAYEQYALEAHRQFVSGYLLKPANSCEVANVLNNLRNPVTESTKGLYVRCFGTFEVFFDGQPVRFGRGPAKEVLAYLIDRNGASVTGADICAILWEDEFDGSDKYKNYLYHIYDDLVLSLKKIGCEDILAHGRNSYAVYPDSIDCDYYRVLKSDARSVSEFRGEYMSQYSWAEGRIGYLSQDM